MENQAEIKHILCAVRSRPGAEETVERAIERALETNAKLIFCQIVNAGFVNRLSSRGSARKAASQELADMAEFALSLIRDHAEQRGVADVDTIVRIGSVREVMLQLVAETQADLVILGRPRRSPRSNFDPEALAKFAAEIEAAGAQVDY